MEVIMRKILTILIIGTLLLSMSFTGYAQMKFLAIATGGTGGTYYPLGGALAQMLSNNIEGVVVTAQTANASVANCNLIIFEDFFVWVV